MTTKSGSSATPSSISSEVAAAAAPAPSSTTATAAVAPAAFPATPSAVAATTTSAAAGANPTLLASTTAADAVTASAQPPMKAAGAPSSTETAAPAPSTSTAAASAASAAAATATFEAAAQPPTPVATGVDLAATSNNIVAQRIDGKSNLGAVRGINANITALMLFTYIDEEGRSKALDVNSNPVSCEISGLIQNMLCGNPLGNEEAEAFQLNSSAFSVVVSNRPARDAPVLLELSEADKVTKAILVDAASGMNGVVKKPGQVCTPFDDSDDMIALRSASSEDLASLLSNCVSTKSGRLSFVQMFNRIFPKKMRWNEDDESRFAHPRSFITFMHFKKRFEDACELMMSNEEANHRLQTFLFNWAGLKCHPKAVIQTQHDPPPEATATVEYLREAVRGIDQNVLCIEGCTTRFDQAEAIVRGNDTSISLIMNGCVWFPLVPNTDANPVTSTLAACQTSSRQYNESKLGSSKETVFQALTKVLEAGLGGQSRVLNLAPFRVEEKGKTRAKVIAARNDKGKVVEIKMKHDSDAGELSKAAACLLVLKQPEKNLWFWDGNNKVNFPFCESFRMLQTGNKGCFDIIELDLIVTGSEVFRLCLAEAENSEVIERFLTKCVECSYFNLSSHVDLGLPDEDGKNDRRLGNDGNKYLAAGIMINVFYATAIMHQKGDILLKLFDNYGRGRKEMITLWQTLRQFLGLNLVLSKATYTVLEKSDTGVKMAHCDAMFVKNMFLFSHADVLLKIIDAFGSKPVLRTDIDVEQLTEDPAIQELFKPSKLSADQYAKARKAMEDALFQGITSKEALRSFKRYSLLQTKGWYALFGSNVSMEDGGGGNLLLELLRLYTINYVRKVFLQEKDQALSRGESVRRVTWMWGGNTFNTKSSPSQRRNALTVCREEDQDVLDLDDDRQFSAVRSPRSFDLISSNLFDLAATIFLPANASDSATFQPEEKQSLGIIKYSPEEQQIINGNSGSSKSSSKSSTSTKPKRQGTTVQSEESLESPEPKKQKTTVITPVSGSGTGHKGSSVNIANSGGGGTQARTNDGNPHSSNVAQSNTKSTLSSTGANTEDSGVAEASFNNDDAATATVTLATKESSIVSIIESYKKDSGNTDQRILRLLQLIETDPKHEELRCFLLGECVEEGKGGEGEGEDSEWLGGDNMDIDVITLQDDPFHRVRGQIESRGLRVTCAWYLLLFDILQCIKVKGAGDGRNETDFDFGETLTDSYEDHYRYLREFVKMQMLTQRVILHTDIIQDDGSVIEDSARTLELNPDCRDIDRSLSLPTIRIHMSVRNENNELKVMGYMTLEGDHIVDEQYLMSPDLFDGNKLKMF